MTKCQYWPECKITGHCECEAAAESADRPWPLRGRYRFIAVSASLLVLIYVIGMVAFAVAARAHEAPTGWKYPYLCCSNRDCGMLPTGAVREGPNGFQVTILPGQHDMVKDHAVQFLIPYGQERIAPDGADHICISPDLKMLCFFTGGRGF
jgi:hypothetical protein